jgi:hypothetical protein
MYDHSGVQGMKGRNQSRHSAHEYARTHYHSTLFRFTAESWRPVGLELPGVERSVTGYVALNEAAARVKELRLFSKTAILVAKQQTCPAEAAWFISNSTSCTGRFLCWRGGIIGRFRMGNAAYRDSLRRRLLFPPTRIQVRAAQGCGCHQDSAAHPTHLLDCSAKNTFYYDKRHHDVCNQLAHLLCSSTNQHHVDREVNLETGNPDGRRADLVVDSGGCIYIIDVCITNPSCRTTLVHGSDRTQDVGAGLRETSKRASYARIPSLHQDPYIGHEFVPFVVEATGRLGPSALEFLKSSLDSEEDAHARLYFLSATSACIALFNSLMISGATRKLSSYEQVGI